ncbi:MAG: class I SAM-dependent methyltransferase [Candidatus Omnitrophica bacterium]|nr:class I SAM-dependent methyltransferase [Candidatus Omnitrophota bacterium]
MPRLREDAGRSTVNRVMKQLDAWVARHGNGKYERGDWVPMQDFMIPDDAGIQQDRDEIKEFVSLLLSRKRLGTALEVGLGYYGSTHFLWRLLFKRIITIEKSHERIRIFGTNMRAFHDRWALGDRRSAFIIGMSYEPATVAKTYQVACGGVDLLFIDGDHQYASVLTDWLLYSPLVKPGGLIAFHDVGLTVPGHYGVPEFLARLAAGAIDGRKRTLTTIRRTKHLGVACYEQ